MDFQFGTFRSVKFQMFSYDELIGYYNFLRLIPVQYFSGSNSDEFKLCIREMLNRKIDILSIQTKTPSFRAQEESEKATNAFLEEFFAIVDPEKFEQVQSQQSAVKKVPIRLKRKKREQDVLYESIADAVKVQTKQLSQILKASKNNISAFKKYAKFIKNASTTEQLSMFDENIENL